MPPRPLVSPICDMALGRMERVVALLEQFDPRDIPGPFQELRLQLAGLSADLDRLRVIERGYNEILAEAEEQKALLDAKSGGSA